jgi:hypothetical protein
VAWHGFAMSVDGMLDAVSEADTTAASTEA